VLLALEDAGARVVDSALLERMAGGRLAAALFET
jgi:hypothetical protein